jgi:hypothetical protein
VTARRRRFLPASFPALAALLPTLFLAACGSSPSSAPSPTPTLSVSPATVSLELGAPAAAFTASASAGAAGNAPLIWQVDGVEGGNAATGTITAEGVYQAPTVLPANPTVTITAVSTADPSLSASATVTLLTPPVSVAVLPPTSAIEIGGVATTFTAVVLYAKNPAVVWRVNGVEGGNAASGTISASGLYVSPAAVPNPATVTVSAVSVEDPTRSGSTVVTLSAPPAANAPPPLPVTVTLAPTLATAVAAGAPIAFAVTVGNTANVTVTWAVNGIVGGNATVGTISASGVYTPPANAPSAPVTVTATSVADPTAVASGVVSVTSRPTQTPLTISGAPVTAIAAGVAYAFTPTVSAAANATLTYTIQAKPAWATFSATTGTLSGTPTLAEIGAYDGIVIAVSDGTLTATLPAFDLTVREAGTGSATVHWVAPTTDANGLPLTGLAGYWVYYGPAPQTLVHSVQVPNPAITAYQLTGLAPGIYYFAATAYDENGVQSVPTTVVTKTIP